MSKQFKPLKAVSEELSFEDLEYPVYGSVKLDGVYGLNLNGNFVGRSLKPMKNEWLTEKLSDHSIRGLCGEICHANIIEGEELSLNRQDLCRSTTSKVNTIKGGSFPMIWALFDYISDGSEGFCYSHNYVDRMHGLYNMLDGAGRYDGFNMICGIKYLEYTLDIGVKVIVPDLHVFNTPEELETFYELCVESGYEGIIARNPKGAFKFGRSTAKSQELVRFKPHGDSEIVITHFEPMYENQNEAKKNELGETERSSHKENKVMLPMVGALIGIDINTGLETKIGAGKLDHMARGEIWHNQGEHLGRLSKYRSMATGVKDKPRHPRHIEFRALTDVEISDDVRAKVEALGITLK